MWKMINGKLYIFGGQASKDAFDLDEAGNLALAERYWREEVAGGNSFLQRAKRLVLRVPHYKSGEELAQAAAKARQAAVDRFQNDATIPVFLISLKAGGTGLNLTGADTVVHYDPWWNPAVEAQATDRTHRIGQTKVVTSYRLICSGTVEEKVMALQEEKRALLAGVFEASDAAAAKLSLADLRALLK